MWVSLQIILDRKDAYPEELIGLVIVIFDSLFNFPLSCWLRPNSDPTETGAAKTAAEPTAAHTCSVSVSLLIHVLNVCVSQLGKHD